MTTADAAGLGNTDSSHGMLVAYLRELRHDREMSLEDLAMRVGLSPVALAAGLCGQAYLSSEVVAQLAAALGVDPAIVTPSARCDGVRRLEMLDDAWYGFADGRPGVVAKEGSD